MSRFIYADHAGTTALSQTALAAMTPYFTEQYGNPSSLYRFGQEAKADLERARADIAACIGAKPEEIFFTSGGTEADNWALKGVVELMALKGKTTGHIITSAIEHHALLHTAQHLEKQGYEVTYLPVDGDGLVTPEQVRAALRPGQTARLVNAGRLRLKECDRLAAIPEELNKLGGQLTEGADFLEIRGVERLLGGVADSHNAHRIAMMLAVAATRAEGTVTIRGAESVAKSYPDFWEVYESLGGRVLRQREEREACDM